MEGIRVSILEIHSGGLFSENNMTGLEEKIMTLLGFLLLLLIAAIAGSLGQAIAGYSLGGCIASVIIGFVGAYIGVWLAQQLSLPAFFVLQVDGRDFPLVWAIIGSALLSAGLGLIFRYRRVL
jgi:uncharacterized membrane protein YeaQ/YmgE (transglycosylase-associated protein family)